jgi:2-polyprenyl-6-methoxyphenol hydroxylase-like FAD-dependent oxidoreductase
MSVCFFSPASDPINVAQDDPPKVRVRMTYGEREISARLVVGADGRDSRVRDRGQSPSPPAHQDQTEASARTVALDA